MKEVHNIAIFGHKRFPSSEGGVEIVVEELGTRLVQKGYHVTCFNRRGHHVSGAQFDKKELHEYKGIDIRYVFTIEKKGFAALTASFFAALRTAFGNYDVVHIHGREMRGSFCRRNHCSEPWRTKIFSKTVWPEDMADSKRSQPSGTA